MDWWQVIVITGAILFAGFYIGNSIANSLGSWSYGLREAAQRLEHRLDGLAHSVARISGAITTDDSSEHLEVVGESLKGVRESLQTLLGMLSNADVAAQHVRLIRDSVKRMDDAEQRRQVWEQERQKEHDAWTRAAREEVDKLSNKDPKK